MLFSVPVLRQARVGQYWTWRCHRRLLQHRHREQHPNLLIDVCTLTQLVRACQRASAAVSVFLLKSRLNFGIQDKWRVS